VSKYFVGIYVHAMQEGYLMMINVPSLVPMLAILVREEAPIELVVSDPYCSAETGAYDYTGG
jgi:hypothetical protein